MYHNLIPYEELMEELPGGEFWDILTENERKFLTSKYYPWRHTIPQLAWNQFLRFKALDPKYHTKVTRRDEQYAESINRKARTWMFHLQKGWVLPTRRRRQPPANQLSLFDEEMNK
jgi:hypothetical protein